MQRVRRLLAMMLCGVCSSLDAGEKTRTVVMLGDSTTLCSYSEPGTKLLDHIQSRLVRMGQGSFTLINAGVNRDTAKGGFQRLEKSVLAHHPDLVTVSFGLNDTGTYSPKEFRQWLEKIVQAIQKNGHTKILLVTSTPFNNARHQWAPRFAAKGGLDEYLDTNICSIVRDLAGKYKLPVCDLHRIFADKIKKEPQLVDVLLARDGVHLTNEGNRLAAEHLAPMIAATVNDGLSAVREDSRIGFERSCQYFYLPLDLIEKAISCRWLLTCFDNKEN
jgi:lysophospholipase L1-like esterase